ncbi:STAS domain-containing protein [Heliophilum fasciatum]|uniref:Anti-sigma factor antagonist n=1 Tax=Heliophilum fasciatum TaxID=35700 RepID=A0A4R2S7N1_9FIRM|nr:STAS domain-containing protein [Heliophilum fasciatum]MCW2277063.1 anti-sigma B factor antagonist [Heliophilum fasciatum]TCP68411.1 anti-sigma-factor antagonist [Heliophilum fasciatum]
MIDAIQAHQGQVNVVLSGSLTINDAGDLREKLLAQIEKGNARFVIDVSLLNFIDSAGLGVLVTIHKRARQMQGGVTMKGLQGVPKEVMELTRLIKVFDMA